MADINKNANINVNVKGDAQAKSKLGALGEFIKKRLVFTFTDLIRIGQKVVQMFKAVSNAAAKQQSVLNQTNTVLRSTGYAAGITADEVNRIAQSLQQVTTYGDENIQQMQNLLLTFTRIGKDIFPEVTEIALDMSQALGQDLKSSAIQLGKALNDPITGAVALRRVGVALTDQQMEQIKAFQSSGQIMKAQKLILKELSTEFGGTARASVDTYEGAVKQLKNAFGDLNEEIGESINQSGLWTVKVLTNVVKTTDSILDWIEDKFTTDTLKRAKRQREAADAVYAAHKAEEAKKTKLIEEQLAMRQQLVKDNALAEIETVEQLSKSIVSTIKKRIVAELTAEQAAAIATISIEIAKSIASFNFVKAAVGISQLGVPVAQAAAAIGAVNSIQFAQGGQFETQANPQSYSTTSGQGAVTNEKGIEIHKVEAIGKSTGGGSSVAPIVIMLGQKELKRIAVDLKPYLNAVDRGII